MENAPRIEKAMSEAKPGQENGDQGRHQADARMLGQMLAAQNVVFTMPDTIRIAEFYAQVLPRTYFGKRNA
jgi:hypothetical protein